MMKFNLREFENDFSHYERSRLFFLIWLIVRATAYKIPFPGRLGDKWRVLLLRLFGATIGDRTLIRKSVIIHFPWKLQCGSDVWLGEHVDIYNLDRVAIGSNVCISQYSYICTGSHDYNSEKFAFRNKPIVIEDGCWIACRVVLLPGCVVKKRSFVAAGSILK